MRVLCLGYNRSCLGVNVSGHGHGYSSGHGHQGPSQQGGSDVHAPVCVSHVPSCSCFVSPCNVHDHAWPGLSHTFLHPVLARHAKRACQTPCFTLDLSMQAGTGTWNGPTPRGYLGSRTAEQAAAEHDAVAQVCQACLHANLTLLHATTAPPHIAAQLLH